MFVYKKKYKMEENIIQESWEILTSVFRTKLMRFEDCIRFYIRLQLSIVSWSEMVLSAVTVISISLWGYTYITTGRQAKYKRTPPRYKRYCVAKTRFTIAMVCMGT